MFGTSPERIREEVLQFRRGWKIGRSELCVGEAPKRLLCCRLRGLEVVGGGNAGLLGGLAIKSSSWRWKEAWWLRQRGSILVARGEHRPAAAFTFI